MCTEELIGESDHLLRLAEEQRNARGGACFRRMQKDGPTDPVEEGQMRPSNVRGDVALGWDRAAQGYPKLEV